MKKLNVNSDACIGCGACVAIDSTHFDFDENGLSEVINNENIETEEVQNAMASCPTNAISYIEESETNVDCNCEKECEKCNCENNCETNIEGNNSQCHNENCECEDCHCGDNCNCDEDNHCNENCHCNHEE